jgi:hypothetical protein
VKLFKAGKKSLGIVSRRSGFGPGSHWLWQLPRESEGSTEAERQEEIKTVPAPRDRIAPNPVPVEWRKGVAVLEDRNPPSDVPRHRWRQFIRDCESFLGSQWAERAAQLGWDAMSLFGCRRTLPLSYLGSAGLLWFLNGGRLVDLHRDWAVIDVPVNGSQRVFYRRNVSAKVTFPWLIRPNR